MKINSYKEFREKVLEADSPVLVDFYADWCGPCRMMAPIIEEISAEADGFSVYKLNVDELPEAAEQFGISNIPAIVAFRGGKDVKRQIGLTDKSTILSLAAD